MALGESSITASMTSRTILALTPTRSSRVMPGWRGSPAVITMMSDPAVSA